jgi:endonuclease/exonuclease/phosphatase family metal-dependent hydrolase
MDRRIDRVDAVKLAMLACLLAGCGDLDDSTEWLLTDELQAPLLADVGSPAQLMAPAIDRLRIVTFNVRDGGIDPALLAASFRSQPNLASADIVMLQEVVAFPEEGATRVSRLAQELGLGWFYAPARREHAGTLGDAILSRYPLEDLAVMRLPLAPHKRQRIAAKANLRLGDRVIALMTTHLDTSLNITERILQIRPAIIDLPTSAIVGGDFNTNPYAWQESTVPLLPTAQIVDTDQAPLFDDYMSRLGFENPTAELGPTNERLGIQSRLDAVFVRGFEVVARGVERDIMSSDHWPVWVEIRIAP